MFLVFCGSLSGDPLPSRFADKSLIFLFLVASEGVNIKCTLPLLRLAAAASS